MCVGRPHPVRFIRLPDHYGCLPLCSDIRIPPYTPILKRLEAGEYLETYSVEHNGRLRKYYRILSKGRTYLQEFLQDWEQVMGIYRFVKEANERG